MPTLSRIQRLKVSVQLGDHALASGLEGSSAVMTAIFQTSSRMKAVTHPLPSSEQVLWHSVQNGD